ncbi:disease resistance-like protein DSC1 isoform X2 [Gossypium arboreum]|uniref:disease resistance-like protein DSC1 isoform X2 n=1 Tax=Gossypium arboreum TaxID=29729 RepID=UPI0022F19D7E|nr:disease resistance-like protein DSC1 isoform X2 [Gossypium arboreum]
MSHMDILLFQPSVFENMINLRYIFSYDSFWRSLQMKKLFTYQVDNVFLPDELRYLRWENYPFKSLSSNSNLKNLTLLELPHGNMEQLWSESHQNLRKIPNLSEAINLELLCCVGCESLVEFWNEDGHTGLVNLRKINFGGCVNLRKISNLSRAINLEILVFTDCESLVELWNEDDHMVCVFIFIFKKMIYNL